MVRETPITNQRHPLRKLFVSLMADALDRDEASTKKLLNIK